MRLIGKTFHEFYTPDTCALWRVLRRYSAGQYVCEIVDQPLEYDGRTYSSDGAGTQQIFARANIVKAIEGDERTRQLHVETEQFWEDLELGSVVHYHDAFGRFVRCEVVRTDGEAVRGVEAGQKCLKAIALVGNWQSCDLGPDAYHVRSVRQGHRFRPHPSNIYESAGKSLSTKRYADPAKEPPLPL